MRTIFARFDTPCGKLSKYLDQMCHCFEIRKSSTDSQPVLNWRLLLCSLRLLRFPAYSIDDHLKWGFAAFASEGHIEYDERSTISRSELAQVFTFCAGNANAERQINDKVN